MYDLHKIAPNSTHANRVVLTDTLSYRAPNQSTLVKKYVMMIPMAIFVFQDKESFENG